MADSSRRVAITPKGDYVAGNEYKRLDLVHYGENLYVAKKDNKDIDPSDTQYWMLCINHDIQAIEAQILELIKSKSSSEPILLLAGSTEVTFTFTDNIPENSVVTVLASDPSVTYTNVETSGKNVKVTLEAQTTDVYVKVKVES